MNQSALIQLSDIHKTYRQGEDVVEVLRGVDLTIGKDEFVAVQGSSGSGKSTLLHVIGLLDRPTSGTYLLDGKDVSAMDDDEQSDLRNGRIGFMFQSFYLIPYATALNNVLLPGLYSGTATHKLKERAEELLVQVGLGDRLHFKPGQLSGGQQQRVALARALLNDPALILADEPTGQLDSTTSGEIMELLARTHESGRTIVLVTHEHKTSGYAGRKIVIHDGRILDD